MSVTACSDSGHDVAIVDNLATGKRENLPAAAEFYEVDIRDGMPSGRLSGQRAQKWSSIMPPTST